MSNHLEESGETYWEHFRYASGLGWRLWKTSMKILIHAVLPNWKKFDNQVLPVIEQIKKELVVRQMNVVHHRLTKRVEDRIKHNIVDDTTE